MAVAVRFDHVTKRYLRGGPRYPSLRSELRTAVWRLGGRRTEPQGKLALSDVTFDVGEGESFGIIGPNGAGKTTLLKIVSRISYPTAGQVVVRGRVGALIEVGSGVHPELTARENIWLYGQILGMSKADIRRRFDEIVEFAEIADALDTPVKMYSSGMQLRLGFSVASHLFPEVFVVDEALAVGDAGFQAKCVERMTKLVRDGRTLLFVSHNLAALEAVCQRGVFLLDGRVAASGSLKEVLQRYLDWVDETHSTADTAVSPWRPSSALVLEEFRCEEPGGGEAYAFRTGDDVVIRLRFRTQGPVASPYVTIGITESDHRLLTLCSMLEDGGAPALVDGAFEVACHLKGVPYLPRVYQVWLSVRSEHGYGDILDWQIIGSFRMAADENLVVPAMSFNGFTDGPIRIAHDWVVDKDSAL